MKKNCIVSRIRHFNEEIILRPAIQNSDDAAKACLHLMQISMERLNPSEPCILYYDVVVSEGKGIGVKALWDTYCNETIQTMVRGSRYLAKIREAVWIIGKGDTTKKSKNNNVSKILFSGYHRSLF